MYEIEVFTITQKDGKVYYLSCILSKVWFLNIYDFVCLDDDDELVLSRTDKPYKFKTYDNALQSALDIFRAMDNQEVVEITVNTHKLT